MTWLSVNKTSSNIHITSEWQQNIFLERTGQIMQGLKEGKEVQNKFFKYPSPKQNISSTDTNICPHEQNGVGSGRKTLVGYIVIMRIFWRADLIGFREFWIPQAQRLAL